MIDRNIFYSHVRHSLFHGAMKDSQVEGCNVILDTWEKVAPTKDLRHLAYPLATTFHETWFTMQPIEEVGHGRGHAYGVPSGPWHQVYDGRGDVQLTFEANYGKATRRLRARGVIGADIDLEKDPKLAMRPDIAAMVMIWGMSEGWFTGKSLQSYFHDSYANPHDARRIINGLDKADTIAGYYRNFATALTAPTRLAA